MKRLSVLVLTAFCLIGMNKGVFAQGEAAVPFLLLAPDSRAGGLGESGAGLADNSAAIFWNPAGIAFLTGSEVSFTHSNWLPQFQLDIFYEYATFRQYIEDIDGSISASITFMNFGEFVRTSSVSPEPIGTFRAFDAAATIGYATKLSNDWGFGFNFRIIHSRLSDKPTEQEQGSGVATSVSVDIGAMWRPESFIDLPFLGDMSNRFSIGANLSNLGPKIYYIDQEQADPIPTNFRLGLALRLFEDDFNSFTLTADASKLLVTRGDSTVQKDEFYKAIFTAWSDQSAREELRDIVSSVGLEYWYGTPEDFMFAIRAGFFYEDPSYGNRKFLSMGAGIKFDMYAFDFSYISTDMLPGGEKNHPLSNTLRFTISMGWGGKKNSAHGFPRGI